IIGGGIHRRKEGRQMAKNKILLLAVVLAFGLMGTSARGEEQGAMNIGKPFSLSSMTGTSVLNLKGEYLGRVSDFVIDSEGHVAFVVVSHGGFLRIGEKSAAVPFGS